MKILTRYVLKEHVGPLLFALSALTSLLLLNYIAKQLSNLAGKGLPWQVIAEFLLLSVPFVVAMTFPMAVLVAVLYAFTRLAAENEISAMKANGVAMGRLLVPVAVASVILAVGMLAFNDQVLPRANHRLATLLRDIQKKKPAFALREHVLQEVPPGSGLTLRTDVIDRSSDMLKGVHIYDVSQAKSLRTIHAERGQIAMTTDQRDLILRLFDGYVIDVDRKNPQETNRIDFAVNEMRIRGVGNELAKSGADGFKGDREASICEMHRSYEMAREDHHNALHNHERESIYLVRRALSGEAAEYPPELPSEPPKETSWGSVYCAAVDKISQLISGKSAPSDSATPVPEGEDAPSIHYNPPSRIKRDSSNPASGAARPRPPNTDSVARVRAANAVLAAQQALRADAEPPSDSDSAVDRGLAVLVPPTSDSATSAADSAAAPPRADSTSAATPPDGGAVPPGASDGSAAPGALAIQAAQPPAAGSAGQGEVQSDAPRPPTPSEVRMALERHASTFAQNLEGLRISAGVSRSTMDNKSVEIHKKFALAGACIVFVLIGVPFALRFPKGGVGLVIGASLVIFAISYVGLIAGESLAKQQMLSPFLAMWGANFLLALVGLGFLLRMGRESMSRGNVVANYLEELRERLVVRRRERA